MSGLYTKTGDKGETGLIGGSRVSKADLRVECYGTVDEMGSMLGFARSLSTQEYVRETVKHIQERFFSLAAEIASDADGINKLSGLIGEQDIEYLEQIVDRCIAISGLQSGFVVPGENPPSGALHTARTITRRCERLLIRLSKEVSLREVLLRYVNRLSDAIYALARLEETEVLRARVEEEVRRQLNIKLPFTLENIEKMAIRARQKAAELGVPIVFAAVDDGGNPILLQRMANSFMGSIDIALNKAYTANAFQMPTHTLGEAAGPNGPLYGIEAGNHGRIVLFGGGFPYEFQGRVVGGVGVSGGTVEQDMVIARYAMGE